MADGVKQEFTCLCGKSAAWVVEGKVTATPCPKCGRYYKGIYNEDTLQIEAVEVEVENGD